eukprot:3925994-Prymnesium_polylepis.1
MPYIGMRGGGAQFVRPPTRCGKHHPARYCIATGDTNNDMHALCKKIEVLSQIRIMSFRQVSA